MRIKRVTINNYRSFAKTENSLEFYADQSYFVIVGPNASGKSNLLDAIRWATGLRAITGDRIEPWDFNNAETQSPLELRVFLDPPFLVGNTFNQFKSVGLLKFSAQEYKIGEDKGSIRRDHEALTEEGQQIMINLTTAVAKSKPLTDQQKEAKQKPRPLQVRDIKYKLPIFYLDNAQYAFHLTMKMGSLTNWLASILHRDISRDDGKVQYGEEEISRSEAISRHIQILADLLRTERTDEILNAMADFMTAQLQIPRDSVELQIGLPQGMDLLRKLNLLGKDNEAMPLLPFERLGRGYAALGIVALFRALNNLSDDHHGSIILIEEPEIFLGPHLRALFAKTLQEFASKGNQVIVSTHSPEFFDPLNPKSAVLVRKESGASKFIQWPTSEPVPSFDVSLKHIEPNLNKIIFSKKILFVEGADDYVAVRSALNLAQIEPALHGLEIIQTGGKGNIKHLHVYLTNLKIPHAVLFDADAKSILESIDDKGSMWRLFDPDLEGVLNTTKQSQNSNHVCNIVSAEEGWSDLVKKYPNFAKPIVQVLAYLDIVISNEVVPTE